MPCDLNWDPTQPLKKQTKSQSSRERLQLEDCIDHFCEKDYQYKEYTSFYKRVLASEQISRSVITPIDEVQYCQVINVPDHEEYTFVVQRVCPAREIPTEKKSQFYLNEFTMHKICQKTNQHAFFDRFEFQDDEVRKVDQEDYQCNEHAIVSVFSPNTNYEEGKNQPLICRAQFYVQNPAFLEDSNERAKSFVKSDEDKKIIDATLRLPQLFFTSDENELCFLTFEDYQYVLKTIDLNKIKSRFDDKGIQKLPQKVKHKVDCEHSLIFDKVLGKTPSRCVIQLPQIIQGQLVVKGYVKDEKQTSEDVSGAEKQIMNDEQDESVYKQDILIIDMKKRSVFWVKDVVLFLNLKIDKQLEILTVETEKHEKFTKHPRFKVVQKTYDLQQKQWVLQSQRETKFQNQEKLQEKFQTSEESLRELTKEMKIDCQEKIITNYKIHQDLHQTFLKVQAWGAPTIKVYEDDFVFAIFIPKTSDKFEEFNFFFFKVQPQNEDELELDNKLFFINFKSSDGNLLSCVKPVLQSTMCMLMNFDVSTFTEKGVVLFTTEKLQSQVGTSTKTMGFKEFRACKIQRIAQQEDKTFIFSVLYQDANGNVHLTFSKDLGGEDNPDAEKEYFSGDKDPQIQQVSQQMERTLNYPILAYTQTTPKSDKVCFVNLVSNRKQISLSLGEYQFIKFLETSAPFQNSAYNSKTRQKDIFDLYIQDEKVKGQEKEIEQYKTIEVLVRNKDAKLCTIRFKIKPFAENFSIQSELKEYHQIKLLESPSNQLIQTVQIKELVDSVNDQIQNQVVRFTAFLVKCGCLTQLEVQGSEKYETDNFCLNLEEKQKLLPLPLIAGLNQEVYFFVLKDKNTQMFKLSSQDNKIVSKLVFEIQGEIISIQLVPQSVKFVSNRKLKFQGLDSSFNLFELSSLGQDDFEYNRISSKAYDIAIFTTLPDLLNYEASVGLTIEKGLFDQFKDAFILDQRRNTQQSKGISVLRSVFSNQGRSNEQTSAARVIEVMTSPLIGKHISLLKQPNLGQYFLTETDPSKRDIDLFDFFETNSQIQQIKMTDGYIFALYGQEKGSLTLLVFNRITLILVKVYEKVHKFYVSQSSNNLIWIETSDFSDHESYDEGYKEFLQTFFSQLFVVNFGNCIECNQQIQTRLLELRDNRSENSQDKSIEKIVFQDDGQCLLLKIDPNVSNEYSDDQSSQLPEYELKISKKQNFIPQNELKIDQDVFKPGKINHGEYEIKVLIRLKNQTGFKLHSDSTQVLITRNYLVLATNKIILFTKFDQDQDIIQDSVTQVIKLNEIEIIRVNIQVIPFYPKGYDTDAFIQIVGLRKLIGWNLSKNNQAKVLLNQREFIEPQSFVNTGFTLCDVFFDTNEEKWEATQFSTNKQQSAFCKPFSQDQYGSYFKPYSIQDLQEIINLENARYEGAIEKSNISRQVFVSEVYGRTVFECLLNFDFSIIKKLKIIVELEKNNPIFIEQLGQILIQPTTTQGNQTVSKSLFLERDLEKDLEKGMNIIDIFFSIQNDWMSYKLPEILDCFYNVLERTKNNNLPDVVTSVKHYAYLTQEMKEMRSAQEFLKKWRFDDALQFGGPVEIPIVDGQDFLSLNTKTDQLSLKGLKKLIRQKFNPGGFSVEKFIRAKVYAYHIANFSDNVKEFFVSMSKSDDPDFFKDNFMQAMLENQSHRQLLKIYIPYLFYLAISLFYFTKMQMTQENNYLVLATQMCMFIGNTYFIFIEQKQCRNQGLKEYLKQFWNVSMLTICVLNYLILIYDYRNVVGYNSVIWPSLSAFLMVFQLFYLNQMVKGQSMYFSVFSGVLLDAGPLYFNGLILIFGLAMAMLVIQNNNIMLFNQKVEPFYSDELEEVAQPITQRFGDNGFYNSMFQQYLAMLGEFELLDAGVDTYTSDTQTLTWIWFLISTILSQLLFLNLLIGVMAESYNTRWAKKELYGRMMMYQMFADFQDFIRFRQFAEPFVYVIEPVEEEEEDPNKEIKDEIDNLKDQVGKILDFKTTQKNEIDNLKDQVGKILDCVEFIKSKLPQDN